MLNNMNFTEARANLSYLFDKVINEQQPVMVCRKREEALVIKRELLQQLLNGYRLSIEELAEDDGSITLGNDLLEIYVNADTKEKALHELIQELNQYTEDYMLRLSLFLHAPNRKDHLPYVMRILLSESDNEIQDMLKFGE